MFFRKDSLTISNWLRLTSVGWLNLPVSTQTKYIDLNAMGTTVLKFYTIWEIFIDFHECLSDLLKSFIFSGTTFVYTNSNTEFQFVYVVLQMMPGAFFSPGSSESGPRHCEPPMLTKNNINVCGDRHPEKLANKTRKIKPTRKTATPQRLNHTNALIC